jgi:hypothetical protein
MSNIREVLVSALKDVDEAKIPEDLRELAFSKAVDLHSGTKATPTLPASSPGGEPAVDGPALERIASKVSVSADALADVYHESSGEVELIVGVGKLSSKSASATKEIALLLAAGRQGAGEEWTDLAMVRAVCEQYKKLDTKNFAAAMKEMEDVFTFTGGPRTRKVKMTRPAWDRAKSLIEKVTEA